MAGAGHELALGLTLGLGAGLAPGPLMALTIRTALEEGFGAGARAACGPLLTDLPIVLLALLVAGEAPDVVLGVLGIAGGLFVAYLGIEGLREVAVPELESTAPTSGALRRGALVNLLNPHPWVFWLTVGAPILADTDATGAAAFLVPFYVLLVGLKIAIAAGTAAGRARLLRGRGFAIALRTAAGLMLVAAVLLIVEGVGLLS